MSKTVEDFFTTIKQSNIIPSFYYTNYQRVAEHMEMFEELLDRLPEVSSKEEFVNAMRNEYIKDNNIILIVPLFTGVRPDKLRVLNDQGKTVEKFSADSISFEDGMDFLEEVGFLERISENAPFNLKSYFFGVNVGLDSNGRKNRSGEQMEKIVGSYLKGAEKDFTPQADINKVNKK